MTTVTHDSSFGADIAYFVIEIRDNGTYFFCHAGIVVGTWAVKFSLYERGAKSG